jgi:hypothetical protein
LLAAAIGHVGHLQVLCQVPPRKFLILKALPWGCLANNGHCQHEGNLGTEKEGLEENGELLVVAVVPECRQAE